MKLSIPTFDDLIYNICKPEFESEAKDVIELLLVEKVLQPSEEEIISIYERIKRDTGYVPSLSILQQSCPTFRPQAKLEIQDLMSSTRLFIKDRINKEASRQLLEMAGMVAKEGINDEISDNISKLLKSDSVSLKYENIFDNIGDIYERDVDKSGIKTATRKIDDYIGGLKAGQMSVIAGFTGHGKSTFCVGLTHSAMKQGFNVCYLSLELNAEHILYDLISNHSVDKDESFNNKFNRSIINTNLKNKTLSKDDWTYVKNTILPDLRDMPGKVYIVDEQQIEAYTFFAFNNKLQEIENLAIEETGHGIDLIVVDHVQQFQYNPLNSRSSVNETINVWVNYFRKQALDFLKTKRSIHVTLCAQLNRQGYTYARAHEGMYHLTALKEANEIETAASIIITVYSDPQLAAGKEIKFGILKNRDGERMDAADTIYCDFAHQVIGGDGSTSSSEFSSMTMDDVANATNAEVDVDRIRQEMMMEEEITF